MTVDRGQTWPVQYAAHEQLILRQQAKQDRRALPARWYWRLLTDENTPGGTAQDDVYGEALDLDRVFAPPVPVHIYIDPTGRQQGQKRGRVAIDGSSPATFGFSRSEARRLGALFGTQDDVNVGLVPGVTQGEPLYIPRPGDLVLYSRRFWQIQICKEDYLGPTDIVMTWQGTVTVYADDISDPLEFSDRQNLPRPPSIRPPDTRTPAWLG